MNPELGPTPGQIARMQAAVHERIDADVARAGRRRGWTFGAVLAGLVLIAGGTSAAMATGVINGPSWLKPAASAPTPAPSQDPLPSFTTAPIPTPTVTTPPPSFSFDCGDVSIASFDRVMPGLTATSTSAIAVPSGTAIAAPAMSAEDLDYGLASVAVASQGYFDCNWSMQHKDYSGYFVDLTVLPNGPDFTVAAPQSDSSAFDYASDDPHTAYCSASLAGEACVIMLRHKDYAVMARVSWTDIAYSDAAHTVPVVAPYEEPIAAVADSAVAALDAAGTFPALPRLAAPAFDGCTAIAAQAARTAPEEQLDAQSGQIYLGDDDDVLFGLALSRSTAYGCYSPVTGPDAVVVVDGAAAWAWPAIEAGTAGQAVPIQLPGTDAALRVCSEYSGCRVLASIDGAVVSVVDSATSLNRPVGDAAKLIAAVVAAAKG